MGMKTHFHINSFVLKIGYTLCGHPVQEYASL